MEDREQPYKRPAVTKLPLHQRVREVMELLRPPSPICSATDLAQPRSGYLRPKQSSLGDWSSPVSTVEPRFSVKRLREEQIPDL